MAPSTKVTFDYPSQILISYIEPKTTKAGSISIFAQFRLDHRNGPKYLMECFL